MAEEAVVMQRVEVTLSVVMPEDPDQQNALGLNLLTHLTKVAERFGVDLTSGEVWAMVTPGSETE